MLAGEAQERHRNSGSRRLAIEQPPGRVTPACTPAHLCTTRPTPAVGSRDHHTGVVCCRDGARRRLEFPIEEVVEALVVRGRLQHGLLLRCVRRAEQRKEGPVGWQPGCPRPALSSCLRRIADERGIPVSGCNRPTNAALSSSHAALPGRRGSSWSHPHLHVDLASERCRQMNRWAAL